MTTRNENKLISRWWQGRDGTMAIMFGLTVTMLLMVVGFAIDYNRMTTAQSKAQMIADAAALDAAIYFSQTGHQPTNDSEGYTHNKRYKLNDIGYGLGDYADDQYPATLRVRYDEARNRAVASVEGQTKMAFMGIFGKKTVKFAIHSESGYGKKELTRPASIFLALDNSGSMNFDDRPDPNLNNNYNESTSRTPDAERRMAGLKSTLKGFMSDLDDLINDAASDDARYLRTAMYPYTDTLMTSVAIAPQWGPLSESDVNSMAADGGTNSSLAMSKIATLMPEEDALHQAESNSSDALKYVILMSDGVNDSTSETCDTVEVEGHFHWRHWVDYYQRFKVREYNPGPHADKVWATEELVCKTQSSHDVATLNTCSSLKNDGVQIYTIGYSLEPGVYHRNDGYSEYVNMPYERYHYILDSPASQRAYALLQGCASSPDHFIKAENGDALTEAFGHIATQIAKDAVRLTQ